MKEPTGTGWQRSSHGAAQILDCEVHLTAFHTEMKNLHGLLLLEGKVTVSWALWLLAKPRSEDIDEIWKSN